MRKSLYPQSPSFELRGTRGHFSQTGGPKAPCDKKKSRPLGFYIQLEIPVATPRFAAELATLSGVFLVLNDVLARERRQTYIWTRDCYQLLATQRSVTSVRYDIKELCID